jgi:hypothetical protein
VRHRWEVAAANAYPWLVAVDEDFVGRPPTAREVAIAEAIALALTKLLARKKVLLAAWNGAEPLERTLKLSTHAGKLEVTLRVPYASARFKPPYDVIAGLYELGQDADEMDEDTRTELEDELMRRLVGSPEGATLPDIRYCQLIMDFAATYFEATIATLRPTQLREIVFEIIPNMVSVDASEASRIIYDNRVLYVFLKREFGFMQADACLRVLAHSSVKKLELALSKASQFQAGFDLDSEEGIEAWMQALESRPQKVARKSPKKKR